MVDFMTALDKRGFTIDEAVTYLGGTSESGVRRLIRDNKLAARKLGKNVVILREELDRFLDQLPERL
jgi:excisionase family DNA binding protein